MIHRDDGASFRTRERITREIVDDTTGRWLGFYSSLRAGQATAAFWAYGWLEPLDPDAAKRS